MKSCNHYVYITGASVACYRDNAEGLAIVAEVSTPRNAAVGSDTLALSLHQFESHLDRYMHDRYFVITDTQAEAYQAETVPLVSHRDLKLLLNRKLEQRYRSTDYRAVVPHRARPYAFIRNLARRRRSRTTTRILYALINPETLAPWLGALEQRALNVRGLYSLGALMPALIPDLNIPPGADALVVMRTAAGYRHAFVSPSGLRFSRLCVHSAGDSQVAQEIDKTLQYLTMTRLWGVDGRHRALHISVIDAEPSASVLTVPSDNPLLVQPVQIRPRDLKPHGPAKLLDAGNSVWLLFDRAVLRSHGMGCAAGLTLQDAGRRATYRTAALGATAAMVLASVGYVAFTEAATRESAAHARTGEMIAAHLDVTAKDSERMTPTADLDAEQLRAVVQTRDRLLNRNIDAEGLMQAIATALAPHPDLDIDVLEWSYVTAAAGAAPTPAKSIVVRVGGHVNARLRKAESNAAVSALAAAIGRQLGGAGIVEKLPFDLAPEGSLTGKPHDGAATQPQFSVTATVPVGIEP